MNRTPPTTVRRQLRKEVGFGCPVNNCRNPYLSWHHFNPPWNEKHHHNTEGMIALCSEHHAKADSGAFTIEQLSELKKKEYSHNVRGSFDWMRNKLLAVVGGNFYLETPIIFQYKNMPVIWFNRDENGYFLLNVRMLSTSNEQRLIMEDNFWLSTGNLIDLESPPSGKLLKVKYSNGDYLNIKFDEIETLEKFQNKYRGVNCGSWEIQFPLTVVEIHNTVGGTEISFGPRETRLPGIMLKKI